MSLISRVRSFWSGAFGRARFEAEMEQEFRSHLELRAADLRRAGLGAAEARRRARVEFGSMERYKEEGRDARGLRWLDEMSGDARYALRAWRRSPGFAVIAILTLGLGIGATTAIFSAADAVLLRPLPFVAPDRLVQLEGISIPYDTSLPRSGPDMTDVRQLAVFGEVAAYAPGGLNLSGAGAPRRIQVAEVTPNFFATLGVRPALGRPFGTEEGRPGGGQVVIVSDGFWRNRLGSAPTLDDLHVILNGKSYRVVGVMPRGFGFPRNAEVLLPLTVPITPASWEPFRQTIPSRMIARLSPGTTIARADARLKALYAPYRHAADRWQAVEQVRPLRGALVGNRRTVLLLLLGATALVLLVACANVANLLLSRAATRDREIALRTTLGATPVRVVRQLLVESVMLAAVAGALGVALVLAGIRALGFLVPAALIGATPLQADARVLAFTLVLAVGTGLVFGLAPALMMRRVNAAEILKAGGTGTAAVAPAGRVRQLLLVAEMAFTVMLLVGAGLTLRSLAALLSRDPGLQPERLATLEVTLAKADYANDAARRQFYERVLARLQAMPQVVAAAAVDELPLRGGGYIGLFVYPEGHRPERMDPNSVAEDLRVTPDYFRAMGIQVLSGRAPWPRPDTTAMPEVAINESFARLYWPDRNPVGDRLQNSAGQNFEIVGVVADVLPGTLEDDAISQVYHSLLDVPYRNAAIVTRGRVPARQLTGLLEQAVRQVAPGQAVYNVRTMEQVLTHSIAPRRTNAALITVFAILALVLAVVGVYGVIAFGVARRTREIGIRMALGADAWRVRRGVLAEALGLGLVGVLLGVVAARALAHLLSALVFGIPVNDPVSFAVAPTVVLAAAAVAALVPARRATRINPVEAIREG